MNLSLPPIDYVLVAPLDPKYPNLMPLPKKIFPPPFNVETNTASGNPTGILVARRISDSEWSTIRFKSSENSAASSMGPEPSCDGDSLF